MGGRGAPEHQREQLAPHLAWWKDLGLITSWRMSRDGDARGWYRWHIIWHDGTEDTYVEGQVRAACMAVVKLEDLLRERAT